ncbi:Ser/Thr protein phosphatase [Histomonas meleagridis]|uniref:Ser/Thr protein phosphatase n=1 Tax=Histomonas meleagridis TaxID=135588 RepID=UPI00355A9387|nr:Ser/Thr protein phosphatase [Histomonas meleagridis]KAH0799682.1 Ser/Thr protein phosphatase [Histomonas meleagridis]
MPIAAIVNDAFYCVHGGLSPSLQDLSEIETLIERPIPDISCSIAADLLWSDPNPNSSIVFEKSNRGIGYLYNADAVSQFLEDNKLKCVVRAHEFCEKGYNWMNDDCITIFSSFDYMGKNNEAAIAIVNGTDISIITFSKEVAEMLITKRTLLPEWLLLSGSVMKKPAELIDILSDIGLDAPIVVL